MHGNLVRETYFHYQSPMQWDEKLVFKVCDQNFKKLKIRESKLHLSQQLNVFTLFLNNFFLSCLITRNFSYEVNK
jgi:hypothetical protein